MQCSVVRTYQTAFRLMGIKRDVTTPLYGEGGGHERGELEALADDHMPSRAVWTFEVGAHGSWRSSPVGGWAPGTNVPRRLPRAVRRRTASSLGCGMPKRLARIGAGRPRETARWYHPICNAT